MIARAAPFEAPEVVEATGGRLDAGSDRMERMERVATDSRDPLEGALFVALVGARFDGHDFVKDAVEAGARGVVVSETGYARVGRRDALGAAVQVVIVKDTLRALGDLATYHRRRLGVPVIALTGSNGKTTTKEMLAAVLRVENEVLATEGNLNNLVGLPLTLLGLEPKHRLCVAEMGMNARGEIARMVEIAEPAVGAVLNIGPAHIGKLGSLENIARAKGEMYGGLSREAVAVVNQDDPRVVEKAIENGFIPPGPLGAPASRPRRTFGASEGVDVRLLDSEPKDEGQRVRFTLDGSVREVILPLPGRHNALNAIAAVAAATALEPHRPSDVALRSGLSSIRGAKGRLTIRTLSDVTVVDDSYNANAASALAAIETARTLAKGRRLVVAFGEMKELGSFSSEAHRQVGRALEAAKAEVVAVFGPEAGPVVEGLSASTRHEPEDFERLLSWLEAELRAGDVVLVKGSRGSRMERVVARIEERA